MWIIVFILGILVAATGAIIVIAGDGSGGVLIALGAVMLAVSTVNRKRKVAAKAALASRDQAELDFLAKQFDALDRGVLPELTDAPVILSAGEVAHLSLPASRHITKNKVVGHTGGSAGVSFRVAKGVSIRTGSGRSRAVYRDVTATYPGRLILTNQRLVFVGPENGFECKLKDVTAITGDEGAVDIQAKNKNYAVALAGAEELQQAAKMLRE